MEAANLKWSAVSKLLPDWAAGAFESHSGILELKSFLSKHFGLRIDRDGSLLVQPSSKAYFKTRINTKSHEIESSRAIATACARIVAKSIDCTYQGIDAQPRVTREQILRGTNRGWIDFSNLLDYCWSIGIPVLYLPKFPTERKKMEGMVTFVSGRPVIILSKKTQPDWALFILAHELGHIALRHLNGNDGEAIIDESVTDDATVDIQEKEANSYAVSLLTPNANKIHMSRALNARDLAAAALRFGNDNGISPGHVILNSVKHTEINGKSLFALGNAALKLLPDCAATRPVADECREAIHRHLNVDTLREDSFEFLKKLDIL